MLTSSKQTGALPLGSYIFPSSPFRDNLAGSQLGKCQAWSAAPGSSHTAEQRGLGLERRQQLNNSAATLPGMPKQRKHGMDLLATLIPLIFTWSPYLFARVWLI